MTTTLYCLLVRNMINKAIHLCIAYMSLFRAGKLVSRGQSREKLANWSRGDKVEKSLPQRVRNKTKK